MIEWLIGVAGIMYGLNVWAERISHQTDEDQSAGLYVCGVPGTGKTTALYNRFIFKTLHGDGGLYVSTHGAWDLLNFIHPTNVKRAWVISPSKRRGIGINLMQRYTDTPAERILIADHVTSLFKRLYERSWGDNIEDLIYGACVAVLEASEDFSEQATIYDVYRFLQNPLEQAHVLKRVRNQVIRDAFENPVESSLLAAVRKLRRPLANESILAVLADPQGLSLKDVMERREILVADLDQGEIGEGTARFIAEVLMSRMQNLSLARPVSKDQPLFHCVFDEFQTYANSSIASMIEENRKRRVPTVLAHQRSGQLSQNLQDAVKLCGSWWLFRLTPEDARSLVKAFPDTVEWQELALLPNYQAVVKQQEGGYPRFRRWNMPPEPKRWGCHKAIWERSAGRPYEEIIEQVVKGPRVGSVSAESGSVQGGSAELKPKGIPGPKEWV